MTQQLLKTLIVIPVYNHGKTLASVTQLAIDTGYPVVVVDDGSTDNSHVEVQGLNCELIRIAENRGKGFAILTGTQYAAEHGFEAIVTIDADGQHDPMQIPRLIDRMTHNSWPVIVLGAREMVEESVPRSSHFGRAFSNFWVRIECGLDLSDTQSGMRLYPVQPLLQLELTRSRYDFEIEVIVKSVWAGVTVDSVPVSVHYPPGKERVTHFNKIIDNYRLTILHTLLVLRRLLPFRHKRLVGLESTENKKETVTVKNPIKALKKLCVENSSPFLLAVAVWIGVFLGALPLLAIHTIAIIYVSHRLHLNKVAAVAASQFCMPPVVPGLCVEVGHYILKGEFLTDLSWETWGLEAHHRLLDWLVGSLFVGPFLGFVGAAIVYVGSKRVQAGIAKPSVN